MNFKEWRFQYQSDSVIECKRELESGLIQSALIIKGETFEDENGETVNRWEELHASGVGRFVDWRTSRRFRWNI